MFSKNKIAIGIALLLALIFTIPVFAGGWAVITLDELPTDVVAGESFTIGFTVLQHGKTPVTGLTPTITANLYKSEQFVVTAKEDGKPGHYTAELTFPTAGEWNWSIRAFIDQKMPTLSVAAPKVAVVSESVTETQTKTQTSISPTFVISILTLLIGLVSLFIAFQRKSKIAATITALCLMLGFALTLAGTNVPVVEAQSESSSSESSESSLSQIEYGRDLFIAKGCITCHYNSKAVTNRFEYLIVEAGPDLSNFSASPEALFIRLKDPRAMKTDSQMPQLNLTEAEIEALIAFINSD